MPRPLLAARAHVALLAPAQMEYRNHNGMGGGSKEMLRMKVRGRPQVEGQRACADAGCSAPELCCACCACCAAQVEPPLTTSAFDAAERNDHELVYWSLEMGGSTMRVRLSDSPGHGGGVQPTHN